MYEKSIHTLQTYKQNTVLVEKLDLVDLTTYVIYISVFLFLAVAGGRGYSHAVQVQIFLTLLGTPRH